MSRESIGSSPPIPPSNPPPAPASTAGLHENGTQANWCFTNARVHLPDTFGMRVEHSSDLLWASGMSARESGGIAQLEWSSEHLVKSPTVSDQEKMDILLQLLKGYEEVRREKEQKLTKAMWECHSLLTQLNQTKLKEQKMADENAKLKEELSRKDDEINLLKRKFRQEQDQGLVFRSGIRRGRFTMSRPIIMECINCGTCFNSAAGANNSICSYHPKAACQLPNKMVAEVFPEEITKQRYWPCCKQIDTKKPPPCHHDWKFLKGVVW